MSERLPWFPYGILPIAGAQGCASVSKGSWLTIWDPTFWQSVFKRVQSSVCCCIGKATVQCSACTVTLVCFQSWRFGTTLNASAFLCVSNFRNISWFDRSLNCNSFFSKSIYCRWTGFGIVLDMPGVMLQSLHVLKTPWNPGLVLDILDLLASKNNDFWGYVSTIEGMDLQKRSKKRLNAILN